MRIMITGANGRLGKQLATRLTDNIDHSVFGFDRNTLDITDFQQTVQVVQDIRPDLILHCAAWTDVDACALDPDRAIAINGLGTGNVAVAAAKSLAAVLYVSSNEVFQGNRPNSVYHEYDTPDPANPYGYSKYVGEQEVVRLNHKHYIVRTSWLFAHGGKNFMQSIINAAKAGKNLRVVIDEVASPTYTDDLADAIVQLIGTRRYGTYHLVNEGSVSRWTFARYVLDRSGFTDVPVAKIAKSEWKRPSNPPAYCSLGNIAAAQLGIKLRSWQQAVDAFLAKEGLLVE